MWTPERLQSEAKEIDKFRKDKNYQQLVTAQISDD